MPLRLAPRLTAALAMLLLLAPLSFAQQIIKLSTTTSTESSGLLKHLLPAFEAKTNSRVHVISVGTGRALELAKNGDVDVTLVHARASEEKFVEQGHGVDRREVMYNDFILVGPPSDPAGIKGSKDVLKAMKRIVDSKAKFISRSDNSGTDQMEKLYWNKLGVRPEGRSYISVGLGMGEVLTMAAEMQAYTLSDRATYIAYRSRTGLVVAVEGDPTMFNPYGIIAVNPAKYKDINYEGAKQLIDWLTSAEGQKKIASFNIDGQQLFFPAAKK